MAIHRQLDATKKTTTIDENLFGRFSYSCFSEQETGFYLGDLVDGKKDGKGVFLYTSGEKYIGEWKDDKKSGKGDFSWTNGDRYEGEYKDDKWYGHGVLYFSNGNRLEGAYLNSEPKGEHVCVSRDGRVEKLTF